MHGVSAAPCKHLLIYYTLERVDSQAQKEAHKRAQAVPFWFEAYASRSPRRGLPTNILHLRAHKRAQAVPFWFKATVSLSPRRGLQDVLLSRHTKIHRTGYSCAVAAFILFCLPHAALCFTLALVFIHLFVGAGHGVVDRAVGLGVILCHAK